MKFKQVEIGIWKNGDIELWNNERLPNDSSGWSLFINEEWVKDAKTKKELLEFIGAR